MEQSAVRQFYADDFKPGLKFEGVPREVTVEGFHLFAQITGDDHPIHYDAEYARQTRFGKPIAHGLLLMGMTALGATKMSDAVRESMVAFVRQDCRFLAPVFVGDVVTSHFEVESVERKPKGDAAIVTLAVKLVKAPDITVLEGHHAYQILYRAG